MSESEGLAAGRPRRRARRWFHDRWQTRGIRHATAFGLFLLVSLLFFGVHVLAHLGSSEVGTGSPDAQVFVWGLRWWPWAIGHAANPFVPHVIWAPNGYNIAWSTTVPGASVVMSPVTLAFGPVVAFDLLSLLAPALAAWAAYLLCHRVTRAFWPAVGGGLVYGFSAYLTNTVAAGHLDLSLVFVPPLAVYLVVRHVEGSLRTIRFVLLLGLVLGLQIWLFQEVFATATIVGAVTGLAALALWPGAWPTIARVAARVALAYGVALAVASPVLIAMLAYPRPIRHLPDVSNLAARARSWRQLATFVAPGGATAFGRGWFGPVSHAVSGSNGSYLGIPLLLIVVLLVATRPRLRQSWLVAIVFAAAALLSFGPAVRVGGLVLPLPWRLAEFLPLVHHALPGRVVAYAFLAGGVAVAMWAARDDHAWWIRWGMVALALVATVPNLSASRWRTPVDVPAFVSSGLYAGTLPKDPTVLVIARSKGSQMLWQAKANYAFRLATGYVGGTPPGYEGLDVQKALASRRIPSAAALQAFLRAHAVRAILLENPPQVFVEQLAASLGSMPTSIGGVTLITVP